MNTQTVQANPNQPIQIQLQYPNQPPPYYPAQTAMHQPYPVFPSIPQPTYVDGYPRWNRHRRLHRSHLRMKNVDWASDDEDESSYPTYPSYAPPYTHAHPNGQAPHMHPQPYNQPHHHHHEDPFSPPSDHDDSDSDKSSCQSFPVNVLNQQPSQQQPYQTQYPINPPTSVPVSSYVPINSNTPHVSVHNPPPIDGIYTNNDERWTVTTYSKTDDDDCTCFSDDTQQSDVHQYCIG